jgi:purine-cytosine permease-like protein
MANAPFIEKRSIDYVPCAERHGKVWHLWPVWFAGDANLATLAVGVLGITLAGNLLWTAIATGLALGASSDFIDRFSDLLAVLLYLFTPWTAINLVDFYVLRKGHYSIREIFNPNGMYGRWNWRGLLAHGVGFVMMIPCFSTGVYTGPVARALGGADSAMLVGLPVAAGVYLLTCRSIDLEHDRQCAAAADMGLEPNDDSGVSVALHPTDPVGISGQEPA